MIEWLRRLFASSSTTNDVAKNASGNTARPSIPPPVKPVREPQVERSPPSPLLVAAQRQARTMPSRVLAIDVETTGLEATDRVVSFAGLLLKSSSLVNIGGTEQIAFEYLVCNPGIKSHPMARRVHGYSDWVLSHQQTFAEIAEKVMELAESADLIVAHNAEFDVGFLNRELKTAGRELIRIRSYCTMTEWRRRGMPGSASLDNVARFYGLSRESEFHSALEDAFLALRVYLNLCGSICRVDCANIATQRPTNFREPLPEPWESVLSRDPVEGIAAAKREGRYDDAMEWLRAEAKKIESGVRPADKCPAAPWIYEQLAILYRKQKLPLEEIEVIEHYLSLPGAETLGWATSTRWFRERLQKAAKRLKAHRTHDLPD